MSATSLPCPKCRAPLPKTLLNQSAPAPCPNCGCRVLCEVFPAFFSGPPVGRAGEALAEIGEASCFFHPAKKAAVACATCGRFLCSLCDLEFDARHICPTCLSSGRSKGLLKNYDQFRLSWSGVALLIAIVPPLAFIALTPANLVFGIVAVVVALIGLKKPRSLTGRRRIVSFTLALLFGIGETLALVWFGGKLARIFYGV